MQGDSIKDSATCTKCGDTWPKTHRYFQRYNGDSSKLSGACKPCFSNASREYRRLWKTRMQVREGFWPCSNCLSILPRTVKYFKPYKRSGPSGLSSLCRECIRRQNRAWRDKNPGRVAQSARERRKTWTPEQLEQNRERSRANYRRNKAEIIEHRRNYHLANKERISIRSREYYERNKEQHLAYSRKRKALKRAAEGTHTFAEVWAMYESQDGLCAYCEVPLFGVYHVDHMTPLSRGGSNDWSNLAITCPSCNLRKNAKTTEEYVEEVS